MNYAEAGVRKIKVSNEATADNTTAEKNERKRSIFSKTTEATRAKKSINTDLKMAESDRKKRTLEKKSSGRKRKASPGIPRGKDCTVATYSENEPTVTR